MTNTVLERTYARKDVAPHSRLATLVQRDLVTGDDRAAPRHQMTAAADPATSRSLALALSAELLDNPAAGRAAEAYRPRKRHSARHQATPKAKPAVETAGQAKADFSALPKKAAPLSPSPVILLPAPETSEEPATEPATVIELPGEVEPSTALVPVPPSRQARAYDGDKVDLIRQMRRTWMSAPFKKAPHCVLLARLRPAIKSGHGEGAALEHPSMVHIVHALGEIGPVFATSEDTVAVLLPKITLHQALRIATAIGRSVDQRTGDGQGEPVLFSAGVAAMYRDDDPVSVLLIAEKCLRLACSKDESAVVGENEPAIRHARLR